MDERTQGALLLAVGGLALRLGFTDAALAYVKPSLQPLLVLAGVALVLLGAATVLGSLRQDADAVDHGESSGHEGSSDHAGAADDGHGHGGGGPRIAWLLMLPLLALLLVAPPPLGSFAAARQSSSLPADPGGFAPLPPPVDGAVPLSLTEFTLRARYDDRRTLAGERVRLVGFVSAEGAGGEYRFSRFLVSCCAADALPIHVTARDPGAAPPLDTWLELEGTWDPLDGGVAGVSGRVDADGDGDAGERQEGVGPPVLQVERRTVIDPPAEPYEY